MSCCPEHKLNSHKHHHGDHPGHSMDHGGHDMSADLSMHGSAQTFLRRFWIVTFLLIPLFLTSQVAVDFLGIGDFAFRKILQFILATIIFGFSLIFFQHARHEIQMKKYGMMTLVSLAVGAGYLFSVVSTFFPQLEAEFYLEISTLVWVLLFGHYLEAKSTTAAGNALQEVAKLLPKKAHLLKDEEEIDVDVAELKKGNIVLIKPGEKVPADGIIIKGTANVDEALISGESKPVRKIRDEEVAAGSICLDGSLEIKLTKVGENSTIGQIQTLIAKAQMTKPQKQKLADKAAGILTFVALAAAIISLLVWSVFLGKPLAFAFTLAITTLVIACPHALGMAIPAVTAISTKLAVKNGIFIKDLAKMELVKDINYVIFDKTGTLTKGEFGLTNIVPLSNEADILKIAGSLEQNSSHVIGQAFTRKAKEENIQLEKIDDFENFAGKGVGGKISDQIYWLGNKILMKEKGILLNKAEEENKKLFNSRKSLVFLANESVLIGIFALADKIKPESFSIVNKLHKLGIKVAMLTGDNKQVAEGVAKELKIDTYFAEVLPEDKYRKVKELQGQGHRVMMVGDGVNDAPALTQADVGVAIGAGTDVAVEAGDIVLTRNNPEDISRLIVLGRKIYRKMLENLIWALGYNVVAIPAAAGVLAPWGFFLRPEIGALIMSLSTVIVVANALTLKKTSLEI